MSRPTGVQDDPGTQRRNARGKRRTRPDDGQDGPEPGPAPELPGRGRADRWQRGAGRLYAGRLEQQRGAVRSGAGGSASRRGQVRSKTSCSCTTGRSTSTRPTWRRSRPSSASRTSSTTRSPTTMSCWPSSPAASSGYDFACPTAEFMPQMAEEGYIQKLDFSRIPNFQYIDPAVLSQALGPEQRVPHPEGLRARPASCTAPRSSPSRSRRGASSTTSRSASTAARSSWWTPPATSCRAAQDAGLLAQFDRPEGAGRGQARCCWTSPRTSWPWTRTRTRTSCRPRRRSSASAGPAPARRAPCRSRTRPTSSTSCPSEGAPVLDGRLGHDGRRAAPERDVRLVRLHRAPRGPGRSRPTTTATRRPTWRPRSSSRRRCWTTRPIFPPEDVMANLEGADPASDGQRRPPRGLDGVQVQPRRLSRPRNQHDRWPRRRRPSRLASQEAGGRAAPPDRGPARAREPLVPAPADPADGLRGRLQLRREGQERRATRPGSASTTTARSPRASTRSSRACRMAYIGHGADPAHRPARWRTSWPPGPGATRACSSSCSSSRSGRASSSGPTAG